MQFEPPAEADRAGGRPHSGRHAPPPTQSTVHLEPAAEADHAGYVSMAGGVQQDVDPALGVPQQRHHLAPQRSQRGRRGRIVLQPSQPARRRAAAVQSSSEACVVVACKACSMAQPPRLPVGAQPCTRPEDPACCCLLGPSLAPDMWPPTGPPAPRRRGSPFGRALAARSCSGRMWQAQVSGTVYTVSAGEWASVHSECR